MVNVTEEQVHKAVVDYLLTKDVMFRTDGGGLRLPIGLAKKFKRLNGGRRAWPDLFIAEPRGGYAGLFIELKKSRDEYMRKRGGYRNTEHIQEQAKVLFALRKRGFYADFAGGIDEAKELIDWYLSHESHV